MLEIDETERLGGDIILAASLIAIACTQGNKYWRKGQIDHLGELLLIDYP